MLLGSQDATGDDRADLIITNPGDNISAYHAGAVFLFSGADLLLP